MLLSAAALVLAGCAAHQYAAPAGAGDSVSYGNPPATTTTAPTSSSSVPPAPTTASATHNQADVTFVGDVVLLRQQAVQLGTLGASKGTNSDLKALANSLADEQYPAVDTLTGWLTQWGASVPSSTSTVTGLLSSSQLEQLEGLSGSAFDTKWVQDMTANHQAVATAAGTEASSGQNTQAKQVAQNLVTAEQDELTQLSALNVQG
jgi:uncharacterized protein (DUF305 family)